MNRENIYGLELKKMIEKSFIDAILKNTLLHNDQDEDCRVSTYYNNIYLWQKTFYGLRLVD